MEDAENGQAFEAKELSLNALREICESTKPAELKNKTFIV